MRQVLYIEKQQVEGRCVFMEPKHPVYYCYPIKIMVYVWIALAGGAGSVCRYLVWRAVTVPDAAFPAGTLTVNLIGCFCIGLLGKMVNHEVLRLTLITGFLGGFTTFSAFGLETFHLLRNGLITTAVWYVTASNVGGLLAAWAGWRVGHISS